MNKGDKYYENFKNSVLSIITFYTNFNNNQKLLFIYNNQNNTLIWVPK